MDVLISGASVAGPVLAYWLIATATRHRRGAGADAAQDRRPRGRPVPPGHGHRRADGRARARAGTGTGTERLTVRREGATTPVTIDLRKLMSALSDRHVEIMRDDLSEILYDATRDDVEYVFGDSITAISHRRRRHLRARRPAPVRPGDRRRRAALQRAPPRLRRRVAVHAPGIGGYLAVASVPNDLGLATSMLDPLGVDRHGRHVRRAAHDRRPGVVPVPARAPSSTTTTATSRGRSSCCARPSPAWAARCPACSTRSTAPRRSTSTRSPSSRMDTWSRGRVTLVGDAGYCPGPAVGGSTSLAVVGAYVLAGELAAAGGDHARRLPRLRARDGDYVQRSRAFATDHGKTPRPRQPPPALGHDHRRQALHHDARIPDPGSGPAQRGLGLHDSIKPKNYPHLLGLTS